MISFLQLPPKFYHSMVSLVTPLSSPSSPSLSTTFRNHQPIAFRLPSSSSSSSSSQFTFPTKPINLLIVTKWRTKVSFFPSFLKKKGKSSEEIKEELFEAIAPLDRGAEATPEDQERIDQIARKLEALGSIKEPLKSDIINGKWELIYTTSGSILKSQRPKFLRPNGKIYQAINADTLRAQNVETWPFFNQAIGDLIPLKSRKVAVKWDKFKIAGLIPIKASDRPVGSLGQLEITYLDEEIRVSRGNRGNLFILKMVDPSYQIPD